MLRLLETTRDLHLVFITSVEYNKFCDNIVRDEFGNLPRG